MSRTRLHLVGDDEALDLLAELARHLPLRQLARVDALDGDDLDQDDIVVIGAVHPRSRDALLQRALGQGQAKPRHVAIVPPSGKDEDAGARAILTAAELVRLLLPELVPTPSG